MKAAKATGKQVASSPRNRSSMFPAALLVPHLAQACVRALDENDSDAPGSSLKKLRLVSRGVKEVLQRRVSGYTLKLGAEHQARSLACVTFLRSVRLLSLTVVFPTLPASGVWRVLRVCDPTARLALTGMYHLNRFTTMDSPHKVWHQLIEIMKPVFSISCFFTDMKRKSLLLHVFSLSSASLQA